MVEIVNIEGEGFKPLIDFNSWRVAQNTYCNEINDIENVKTFGRHLETDEVFVLLEGQAALFTAGFEEKMGEINVTVLEKNKLYNIKQNQWHALILNNNSKVLIIENRDTNEKNSNIYHITEDDRKKMKELLIC
ncbi:hypothetical protein SAMN05443428_101197 [Caloramator quimbayensis]|uniref:Cupin domain-containing protein n=1 Tax=Caloramator quimbayensis TaxID=1147123 RepID=A0A1T4WII4_9CLOT|nr:hypothetical protein [Caloramator quimbayensis]SKA76461.1 hypothetical protein SAMN05443428_101197 [Caloramator quimbayensis]